MNSVHNERLVDMDFEIEALNATTPEERKRQLFDRQKKTLDLFLERNAISRQQYEKSLGDLEMKMGYFRKEEN